MTTMSQYPSCLIKLVLMQINYLLFSHWNLQQLHWPASRINYPQQLLCSSIMTSSSSYLLHSTISFGDDLYQVRFWRCMQKVWIFFFFDLPPTLTPFEISLKSFKIIKILRKLIFYHKGVYFFKDIIMINFFKIFRVHLVWLLIILGYII